MVKSRFLKLVAASLLVSGLGACSIANQGLSSQLAGCPVKAGLVASNSKAVQEAACPSEPLCYYEVYSPIPQDLEDIHVRGFLFKPQLYLTEKGLPDGVSPESFAEDARCYDPQSKTWVQGEPEAVLRQLHCLGS